MAQVFSFSRFIYLFFYFTKLLLFITKIFPATPTVVAATRWDTRMKIKVLIALKKHNNKKRTETNL